MAQRAVRTVLFLGPADRAKAAAEAFNAAAGRMRLPWAAAHHEPTAADAALAARVVALGRAEYEPLVRERFPAVADRVEYWDGPAEARVADLIARLLGGGGEAPAPPAAKPAAKKPAAVVKVGRETAGRRGKGVTTVWDVPLGEDGLRELAATLKQRCGTGGTVKDRRIEIQGDQRDRIAAELEKLGYTVKRAGG